VVYLLGGHTPEKLFPGSGKRKNRVALLKIFYTLINGANVAAGTGLTVRNEENGLRKEETDC